MRSRGRASTAGHGEILQQLYGKWQERLDKNDGELLKKIICIDGKTMCSNKRGEEKASHIVFA